MQLQPATITRWWTAWSLRNAEDDEKPRTYRDIARELGVSAVTVRKYVNSYEAWAKAKEGEK